MGRMTWGKTAALVVLAVMMLGTSACGGEAEAQKPQADKPKPPGVTEATSAFQNAVADFDASDGCPKATGECWDRMQAVAAPAKTLRKAMNADKATGPAFWREAYVLLDTMEDGMAVGEDTFTNRPDVLGSAHDLVDWLDEHPVR